MANSVDIFELLKRIDDFDVDYIDGLTEEEKRSISPFVLMNWMSGCKSPPQIMQVNSFMNSAVFNMPSQQHVDLFLKLALIASDGKRKKYFWPKKGNTKKYSTSVNVIKNYYHCSTKVALEYLPLLDSAGIVEMATELGEQEDTIKKIKKEMK